MSVNVLTCPRKNTWLRTAWSNDRVKISIFIRSVSQSLTGWCNNCDFATRQKKKQSRNLDSCYHSRPSNKLQFDFGEISYFTKSVYFLNAFGGWETYRNIKISHTVWSVAVCFQRLLRDIEKILLVSSRQRISLSLTKGFSLFLHWYFTRFELVFFFLYS